MYEQFYSHAPQMLRNVYVICFSLIFCAVALQLLLVDSPAIHRTLVALNGAMANKDYQHGAADGG